VPLASLMLQQGRPEKTLFYRGLEKAGYHISDMPVADPLPDDLLVLWNRLPTMDGVARTYENCGARVIIGEHGWIGENTYALCLGQHNGAGKWQVKGPSRWPVFGIDVKPWRKEGDYILLVLQRGIGVPPVAQPRDWRERIVNEIATKTDRPIRVRYPQERIHPIWPEFENCHAVVQWASGSGIKAITSGVPVFYLMPEWIGRDAAVFGIDDLENPYLGERDTLFHKLSWAMWTASEIESGEAFQCLLK